MRKALSLLISLLASLGFTAWAQTMPFEPAASATDADAQMYYIYEPDHQLYVKVSSDNILGNGFSGDQFIFVKSTDDNLFYIYNKSCGKYITYTQTTDPNKSVTQSSQSAVQLTSDLASAKTWRIVQEGSADTYDIFPGEATSYTANSSAASWNFRGGKTYALNLYAANDRSSSWQIVAQLSAKLNCATRLYAEPGAKFMHKLVGNNKDDVQSVTGLPTGFTINEDRPDYKYITGTAPDAGEYTYTLNLKDGTTETVRLTVSDNLTQPRPLMGVLTWNAFQNHIDENVIIKLAEGFDKFALKDAGYTYMCIDDQWAQSSRDASGHLQWRTDKFPTYNILADRIHGMGLKIGIYSDAGSKTCSNAQPGSYGNETVDAQDFVNWGFDLLKYDFCNATGGTSAAAAEQAYTAMGNALKTAAAAKNKDFLFYMCEWGYRSPWLWGANTGATCWRATDDTRDYWTHPNGGVLEVLNKMKGIWAYQGVNRWNDADMMCIGLHGSGYSSNNNSALGYGDGDSRCTGLTMAEQRSQMALWCMFASPLTHSNNITNLDGKANTLTGKTVTNPYYREDLAIILNKELIALDQDPLGQAGEPIYDETDYIVFQKDMADGSIGLSITNLSGTAKSITVNFADLSALKSGVTYKMRDLWSHEYVGREYTNADQLTVSVPSHDTFVYRIQDVSLPDLTWEEPVIPGLEGSVDPDPEPELLIDVTKKYRVYNYSRNSANYAWTDQGTEAKTYPLDENRDDQVWQFEATGNADYPYYIKSVSTGKYMKAISAGGTNVQLTDGTTAAGMYNAVLKDGSTELYSFNSGTGIGNYLFTDSSNRLDGWKDGADEFFYLVAIEEPVDPVTPDEGEWVSEYPQTSTIAQPVTYRIHNIGADEGQNKGHNNYVAYNENYADKLQHIGGTEADRDAADEFIFIEASEGVYIYDKTVEKYVKWTANAEGGINWGSSTVSACRVVLVDTQADANTWFIVNDENTEGRYDILPTATSQYGWSFMGGTDRAWVVLNLEGKTNRNCKWVFERQGNAAASTEVELIDVAGLKASASLTDDGKFASNTVWYTIKNYKTGGTYNYMSTATTHVESPYVLKLNVTTKDETAAGQWCLVADANGGYRFYNRALGTDYVLSTASTNGAMVAASSATSTNFSLQQGKSAIDGWFIKDGTSGSNFWNQQSNYLRHWDSAQATTDNNSTFVFEEVEQGSVTPVETAFGITFSNGDDEHYYYIKSNLGDIYLADKGLSKAVRTDGLAVSPAMQWKFVGTKDNCQIVNKQGHYLWLGGTAISASGNSEGEAGSGGGNNDKPLRTQSEPWAEGFKLAAHSTKTGCFTITPNNQANGYGFNVWGGNGANHTIGLWQNTDNNNAFVVTPIENVKLSEYGYTSGQRPADISALSLWYDFPATATTSSNKWMEYGLPIGNGRIGAVLNGGVLREETQFNEKTLYDGTPNDFGSHGAYANFGWFYADDESGTFDEAELKNYTRFLDIEKGVAGVNYESEGGTKYTRRYFTSAPDNVMAMRYTAEGGTDKLHLLFSLKADAGIGAGAVSYNEGKATFDGTGKTVSYGAQFRVASTDGTVTTTATGIEVEGASEILVLMSGLTNCDMSKTTCVSGTKADVVAKVNDYLDAAQRKGYDALYADHVADFSGYMDRCSLQLGNAASQKTTNALIDYYNQSSDNATSADGLFLEQLYFQYGRYLTIACNNINTQVPANLQGIWNNNTNTNFWHSDIHADVNVQMCYWPAEITGLSEMHMPYLDNIIYLSEDARNYHRVAQTYKAGVRGWMLPTENNIYGGCSDWQWNKMKTMNAWYCSHLWQHYRYTLDRDFLKRALPAVLRAAQFVKDISNNTNADGTVYVSDEYSPEHGPTGGHATAFAQQNAVEVVGTVIKAHEILGAESPITAADYEEMENFFEKIDKGLHTETFGGKTCLSEWADLALNNAYSSDAASHRHLSHLMALYPFGQVNGFSEDADEMNLFNAAVNSLHVRNAKNVTGWSGGHKINLHARALEGDAAHEYFGEVMLKHANAYDIQMAGHGGVYYNLWDSHSPFQIDGNFGYCAGVAEMLLQSYDGTVHLLPALPDVWADGQVSGLKAVGNFTVSETWAGKKLTEATVTSVKGGELRVQYGNELLTMMTYPGETYNFYFDAEGHFASYLADATIVNVAEHVKAALQGNDTLEGINAAKNAVLGTTGHK